MLFTRGIKYVLVCDNIPAYVIIISTDRCTVFYPFPKKNTTIAQFTGGFNRLTNQLEEMREENAKELMARDREIERLRMQVIAQQSIQQPHAQGY